MDKIYPRGVQKYGIRTGAGCKGNSKILDVSICLIQIITKYRLLLQSYAHAPCMSEILFTTKRRVGVSQNLINSIFCSIVMS